MRPTLPKAELINQLARARGYTSYIEICTPHTGGYYADIEHAMFNPCHRLMYRCPEDFNDGLPVDFRSADLDIERLLVGISSSGTLYDIVFVDAWHLYNSSIRDIERGFDLVTDGGVLIVHDCIPPSFDLASPEEPVPGTPWCGVTWKAYLDFVMGRGLPYQTVDTDFGCGIISKGDGGRSAKLTTEWAALGDDFTSAFRYFEANRGPLLNLVGPEEFVRTLWFGSVAHRAPIRPSGDIVGKIDRVCRQADGRISIQGWAFDSQHPAAPVWIISLYGPNVVLETSTLAIRPDVSAAFAALQPRNAAIRAVTEPVRFQPETRLLTLAINEASEFAVVGNNPVDVE